LNSTLIYFLLSIPFITVILGSKIRNDNQKYVVKSISYTSYLSIVIVLYSMELIDELSLVYTISIILLAWPISLYTEKYTVLNRYPSYLPLFIDLFSLSMITAYLSPNILGLITAWTIAELIGFILIGLGEQHSIEGSTRASQNFLFISALTFELSIFTLTYIVMTTLTFILGATSSLEALTIPFWILAKNKIEVPSILASLLIIGFIAKSGLVPLHFWLPSAHSVAPSPASSLLSGVMTAMGVYGLLRINMIIETDLQPLIYVLLTISLISILYGGLQAHMQRDGKKLLAYSTIAGNGFSMILLTYYIYTGDIDVLIALIVSILAHMSYKATFFLDIGLAEQITGFRYIHRLRGLASTLPISTLGGLLAFLSIIGVPPTTGFTSKLLSILLTISRFPDPLVLGIFISIILFIVFSIIIGLDYVKIYFGKPSIKLDQRKTLLEKNLLQQYCVLFVGLTNILFTLSILLFNRFTSYVIIYILASPLLLVLVYLINNVMRRET